MSRFDEFVDEFIFMAKNGIDAATKKTGEVVESSKVKYQLKQMEWDIEKAYAKLGAIVYESQKTADNFDEVIKLAVSEIDDIKNKYNDAVEKLRTYKNVSKCPSCGKDNELSDYFCSRCGAPLSVDEPITEPVDDSTDDQPQGL